ncbi:MAG: DUF2442 domain-containing protein [Bacteroidia bacterium]
MKTVIEITSAEYLDGYKIQFHFNDNTKRIIDFENFLSKSHNLVTRQFLDKSKFKSFRLEYGDIIWGDFDMCFPIWDLYEGNI